MFTEFLKLIEISRDLERFVKKTLNFDRKGMLAWFIRHHPPVGVDSADKCGSGDVHPRRRSRERRPHADAAFEVQVAWHPFRM